MSDDDNIDWNDKATVLEKVTEDGRDLRLASKELKKDRDVVLAAVTSHGWALQLASKELKKDRDVVLAAVTSYGNALKYVSVELKNDRDVVLAAITSDGYAFEYASKELQKDRDVVLAAVTSNGEALDYASKELQKDRDVVLAAVTSSGNALEYVSKELQKDRDVVLAAVTSDGGALEFASKELQADRVVVLAAVTSDGWALQFAYKEFQKDRDVVLAAVTSNGEALEYTSKELQKDRDFVLAAVTSNGLVLKYAYKELQKDRELVLAAVTSDGGALQFASKELQEDLEIKRLAMENINQPKYFASEKQKRAEDKSSSRAGVGANSAVTQRPHENIHQLIFCDGNIFRRDLKSQLRQHCLARQYFDKRQFCFFDAITALLTMTAGIMAFVAGTDLLEEGHKTNLNLIVGSFSFVVVFMQTLSTRFKFDVQSEMHSSFAFDIKDMIVDLGFILGDIEEQVRTGRGDEGKHKEWRVSIRKIRERYGRSLKKCRSMMPPKITSAFDLIQNDLDTEFRDVPKKFRTDDGVEEFYDRAFIQLESQIFLSRGSPMFLPNPEKVVKVSIKKLQEKEHLKNAKPFSFRRSDETVNNTNTGKMIEVLSDALV